MLRLYLFVIFIFQWSIAISQLEKFEIEFPRSENTSRLLQDSLGYIWFHDNKNFYRYNGHQVESMHFQEAIGKKKFDYNFTGDLIFRGKEILFINIDRISLFHYESKKIRDLWKLPLDLKFDHIYKDDLGQTWVFTSLKNGSERLVYKSKPDGSFELMFDLATFLGSKSIFWDFEIDDDGKLFYIYGRLGGLTIIDMDGKLHSLNLLNEKDYQDKYSCSQFRLDNLNRLWRIHDKIMEIYDPVKGVFVRHNISEKFDLLNNCNKDLDLSLLNLRSLFVDSKSRIWLLCAASYLVMYDPATEQSLLFRKLLVEALGGDNFDIISLQEDADGSLWGNKLGGIFKIREKENYFESYAVNTSNPNHSIYKSGDLPTIRKVQAFYHEFGVKNTTIHSIGEDEKGDIYFQDGTYTFKIDHKTKQLEILPIFSPKEKVYLHIESDLRLYATWDSYYKLDKNYQQTRLHASINAIDQIYMQSNGRIWFTGLLNQHDYMFGELDNSTLEYKGNFIDPASQLNFKDVKVNNICGGKTNDLWLATDLGILHIDLESNKLSRVLDGFTYNGEQYELGKIVDKVKFISENRLWLKTKYEIALLDLESKKLLNLLPLNSDIYGENVQTIFEGDSAVWMGTKTGIDYHNFNDEKEISISSEGGIDTKGEVRVMKRLLDHRIAVGTKNGLYIFQPDSLLRIQKKKEEYEAVIPVILNNYNFTDGETDQNLLKFSKQISLDYNDRSLLINYGQNNFKYPTSRLYQHQLEGYENEWSEPQSSNETKYSSLPPGRYIFRVKGNIGSGTWSKMELEIPIYVKQAWFRTWGFYMISAIVFVLTVFFIFRYRYRLILQRKLEIGKLRMKISSDLHDDVGTLLSGLAMQSEVLGLSMDEKSRNKVEELGIMSRSAMEKMRDIVWAMDSRRDKYENLLDRMKGFMSDQFSENNFRYVFKLDGIIGNEFISPDVRQNVYLIFKEAITNVAKHSDGDEIEITLSNTKQKFKMIIADNGTTVSEVKGDGMGLSNMEMRAKKVGGLLTIVNENGFKVILEIS